MKTKILATIMMLMTFATLVSPVLALGPTNAGGINDYAPYYDLWGDWNSANYVGPDYGAGWTSTTTIDGTVIDPIGSLGNPATLLAKGHYFSDEAFTEKDWVYYKFWLNEPVEITFSDGSTYTATKFIVLTQYMVSGDIILKAYK